MYIGRGIRFGVTYEGLKHHMDYDIEPTDKRFGVTYEGLKPGSAQRHGAGQNLFWSYL